MKASRILSDRVSAFPPRTGNGAEGFGRLMVASMIVCLGAWLGFASADEPDKASTEATMQAAAATPFEFKVWSACTDRVLHKEVSVRASIDDVWRAWTTSEGMAEFFIPDTKIELTPGGAYELYMGMAEPDESGLRGSEGCKLLSFIPKEMLSFEWSFPPAVMGLRKARAKTIVVIRFKDRGDGTVAVDFRQLGWEKGEDWDKGYAYFDHAWAKVLGMLKDHFEEKDAQRADSDRGAGESVDKPKPRTWVDRHVTVMAFEDGDRSQVFEMTLPAPASRVWELLATSAGLNALGGKNANVELKPGGAYAYWPGASNKVLSYVPFEMLSTSGSAPPQFPNVRKGGTWSAYDFAPVDEGHTRLRLTVVGWQKGEEWDQAFDYFLKNNPVFLEQVYSTIVFPVSMKVEGDQLEMTCTVDAPRSAVWRAFVTKEGMESWMVSHAEIDLRVGGLIRTHYAKDGVIGDPNTIENVILSYEPERMYSIKVGKPPEKFPFKDAVKDMWTVIYLDDAGAARTAVRIVGMGYSESAEHQKLRAFFEQGNAWTLQRLQEHFEKARGEAAESNVTGMDRAEAGSEDEATAMSPEMASYLAHLAAAGMALELGETAEAKRWLGSAPAESRGWEWQYFKAESDQSSRQWNDIGAEVMFVAAHPDGRSAALATTDGRVLLRNIETGDTIRELRTGEAALWHVSFDHDGERMATSSSDGTARIWNVTSGEELIKIPHEKTQVYSASFSPDGKLLATSMLSYVKLWDATTGAEVATLKGHVERPPVTRVVFSPDGKRLASSGWDNWVIVWDVETREPIHKLGPGYGGEEYNPYNAVEFSHDGKFVAAAAGSGKVWIWNVESGELAGKWQASDKNIYAIAYSPDSTSIATGSMDLTVKTWSAVDGALLRSFRGHDGMIRGLAFSKDGETLLSGAVDKTVRLWDLHRRPEPLVVRHERGVWSIRFSPDGSKLVSGGSDHAVRVWDASSGKQIFAFENLPEQVASVAVSPDGRLVAGGTNKPTVMVWSLETGKPVYQLEGHTNGIPGLAFSPDGGVLASASYDGTVRLWNTKTGELVRAIEGPHAACHKAEFSPDGKLLATAGKDGVVRLWDAVEGVEIAALEGHRSRLYCIAFSPDGTLIASSGTDHVVRIWDVASRKCLHSMAAHEATIYGLAFSKDGSRLATGAYDKTIKLWDVRTGLCAATLARTDEGSYDLTFSPDGTRLAVSFADGRVEVMSAVGAGSKENRLASAGTSSGGLDD